MTNPNKHIEDFLDYYYKFPSPPEYAVLLKGAWGSGKTWFINKFLKKLEENNKKYIYVSLYGVTNIKDIEREIITSILSLKSSNKIVVNEFVKKGMKSLKKAFGDKIPEVNVASYLSSDTLLIFDDLERCSMCINDLLGYINTYVEHKRLKVVIIANETIILEKQNIEQSELSYKDIKEKLIGETFEVKADLEGALDDFISKVETEKVKQFYTGQKHLISRLYLESSYDNLRHLKQALWGFERFYKVLNEEIIVINKLLIELLELYLVYSFEIKSGKLSAENLKPKRSADKKEGTPFEDIERKYTNISLLTFRLPVLEVETWEDVFGKGILDADVINSNLLESKYFQENTPDWRKLWNYWEITDDEFKQYIERIEKSIADKKYEEIGELKHIVAAFLNFSKMGIYKKSKKEILEQGQKYVYWLRKNNKLPDSYSDRHRWNDSYNGYGFLDSESADFQQFCQLVDDQINEANIEKLPESGESLLGLMKEDVFEYAGKLVHLEGECSYCDTPILRSIEPRKFVDAFISLPPSEQDTVIAVFKKRYNFENNCNAEMDWLIEIDELLKEKQSDRKGKLSGFRLGRYRNSLKKAINAIQEKNVKTK